MKILVSGPVNYEYSQRIVEEIEKLGNTTVFYPMKEFYTSCSYVERKAYKLGMHFLKDRYDRRWETGLLAECEKFSPDVVIFLNGMMLNPDLLKKLQNYRKIWWLWDSLDRMGEDAYSWIPYFDKIAVFEYGDIEKVKNSKENVIYLPLGYSSAYAGITEKERDIDVSFIGMPDGKRLGLLERLAEEASANNWSMYVGGIWYDERWPWKKRKFSKRYPHLMKYIHNKIVPMEKAAEIYARSKIAININTDEHKSLNPRSFEIMAAGALMFYDTKYLDGNPFKQSEDYCEFDSCEDMLEKVHLFLSNEKERMAIAKCGRKINEKNSLHNRVIDLLNDL